MSKKEKLNFDSELKKCKTMDDLIGKNGLLQKLIGGMVEQLLEQEMAEHLGYEKHNTAGYLSGNSRNGRTTKTVNSSYGDIDLEVPRDRNGTYEPKLVKKRERSIGSFDEKVISMYAKGMTTRDIREHVLELYGTEISPTTVSNITDKVLSVAQEWQSRPLEQIYPVVFMDAIHYKVKVKDRIVSKAAYTCLGVNADGKKEVLGLWIGENEGAKFWLGVCSELNNRGVKDIFIACVDGLKGFPEAIKEVFPETEIQLCVVHLIRNSIKYIPHKYLKEFIADLKTIYQAPSLSAAEVNLLKTQEKWEPRYSLSIASWVKNWEHIQTFFQFPKQIRKLIYTTNSVESLHSQFRKVTKNRRVFPTDNSLLKLLFLSVESISKKWNMPVRAWKEAVSHFALLYSERFDI